MGNALYMLLSAEMTDAPTALRMGLIQKMTKKEDLHDTALDTAKTILKMGPEALKKVKYVCRNGIEVPFDEGCHLEAQQFGTQFKAEGEEGMKAFLEKRKPNWYPNK
jgi:enoyl-CoA hydratase/carnithine racemase